MVTPSCDYDALARCAHPALCRIKTNKKWMPRYFPGSANASRGNDRGAKRSFGKLPMSAKGRYCCKSRKSSDAENLAKVEF
jgi:hypothetical protein